MAIWGSIRRAFRPADEPLSLVPRWAPPPAGETDAPAIRPAAAASSDAPGRSDALPPRNQGGPATVDVEAVLRTRLDAALHQLKQEIAPAEWTSDLRDLTAALGRHEGGHLRQLPSAAQRALSACQDERVPNASLVALFERDPMLAEALLARANSAYYSPAGKPCFSLAEAIVRQGRRSAHGVILQQALGGMVSRPGGGWTEMANKIWAHMVRCGPIARAVAPAFGLDPEQAMTLGLLHDVGKLVVFDRVSALRGAARRELDLPRRPMSRCLRLLHEPLGGLCALQWNLGEEAALAIAAHHREPLPAVRDPASEALWLAERYDLTAERGASWNLEEVWAAGRLSGKIAEAVSGLVTLRLGRVSDAAPRRQA